MKKRKGFQMFPVDKKLSKATFEGFVLKENFWYGYNLRGEPVATSCWCLDGFLTIYTKHEGNWEKRYMPYQKAQKLLPTVLFRELNNNPKFSHNTNLIMSF